MNVGNGARIYRILIIKGNEMHFEFIKSLIITHVIEIISFFFRSNLCRW